jgi:hypothetical protein
MWKKFVQPERLRMTIRCMRIACWITKATNTHSGYRIFIDFALQKRVLRTRLSVTLYVHWLPCYRTTLSSSYAHGIRLFPHTVSTLVRAAGPSALCAARTHDPRTLSTEPLHRVPYWKQQTGIFLPKCFTSHHCRQ